MKKALIITTVSGFLPQFEMNNVRLLQMDGYEVHYAANYKTPVYGNDNRRLDNTGIIRHQVDFVRSPFRLLKHIRAYMQLMKIIRTLKFKLVHCHTPVGGAVGRLAAKAAKVDYIIYTAHGFHFYNGASFLRWALFYPVERLLARITDVLITINQEDYKRALKFRLRNGGNALYIPGIGINTNQENNHTINKEKKLRELGVPDNAVILTSVGELSARKNHTTVIKAITHLKGKNVFYLICGSGNKEEELRKMINTLNLETQILLLGYRKDISEILSITDIFIFPSKQEGLPVAMMEAMAAGLPIICSRIRGNTDLIQEGTGGYLVDADSVDGYADAIKNILLLSPEKRSSMGNLNKLNIRQFDIKQVERIMLNIYQISNGKDDDKNVDYKDHVVK